MNFLLARPSLSEPKREWQHQNGSMKVVIH
jgi:hypothetical protein